MDVSIVIVSYNSADWVERCLAALARHSSIEYETIIVDNASPDGSGKRLQGLDGARLLQRGRNSGFSVAANEGAAAARGDYLLFINPDVSACGDLPGGLSAYLRDHAEVGAIGPRLLNPDGSLQLSCRSFPSHRTALFNRYSLATRLLPGNRFSRDYLLSDWGHEYMREVDWLSGACLMLPRRVFAALGGWDEGFFFSAEDVDLCRRLRDAGLRVVYDPQVTALHAIGASSRTLPNRIILARHAGMWRYYRKHLRGGRMLDAVTLSAIGLRCLAQLVGHNAAALTHGAAKRGQRPGAEIHPKRH